MKCPHYFLELLITPQYDKEVDKCPKCEGIWLHKNDSENTFDILMKVVTKIIQHIKIFNPKRILMTKMLRINLNIIIIKSHLRKEKKSMKCLILNN